MDSTISTLGMASSGAKALAVATIVLLSGCAGIEQFHTILPDGTEHVSVVTHRETIDAGAEAVTQYQCSPQCKVVSSGMQAAQGPASSLATAGATMGAAVVSKATITIP